MGIKYSFVDNAIYGTEDINDIARCLTGAGIAPFLSKDSYSTSDLNSVTAALVSDGVSLDGCRCSVQNAGTVDMRIKVAQGIIFFKSGVKLIVDDGGYSVSVPPNVSGYVFAHYSPSLQVADIKFAEELPDDGEYVELVRVSANGGTTDRRHFAESKVATMGKSSAYAIPQEKITSHLSSSGTLNSSLNGGATYYLVGSIDLSGIDISRYTYLFYKYKGYSHNNRLTELYERYVKLSSIASARFYIKGTDTYNTAKATKFVMNGDVLEYRLYSEQMDHNMNSYDFKQDFDSAIPYFTLI